MMNELAELRTEMKHDVANAHRNQWSADLMSSNIDDYITAKIKELGDKSKHAKTLKPRMEAFVTTVGDKPLRDHKRDDNFLASIKLASIRIWLRFNESMT